MSAFFFLFAFFILQSNTTITHLELEDNWILAEGTTYLVQMLRENCYIQEMVFCVSLIGQQRKLCLANMPGYFMIFWMCYELHSLYLFDPAICQCPMQSPKPEHRPCEHAKVAIKLECLKGQQELMESSTTILF